MKDLSEYIESIISELIPKSSVRVHLAGGIYRIWVDVYEMRYINKTTKDLIKEFIDKTLQQYFPNGLENIKIVNVYFEEYG